MSSRALEFRRRLATCAVILSSLGSLACESAPMTALVSGRPEVDAIFAEYDRADSPGCALGVIRDGEFAYRRGYGMANLEYDIPIDADTVFRIGSVSKQFTAMTILLLEEAGKVALDADIRAYLPEMPDFGETVTVADLMHHTSGIRDYLTLMTLAGYRDEDYYDGPELYRLMTRQRELNFMPGAEFLYSNSGYFLLGRIAERVSGKPFPRVAAELIFEPLGMASTHFHDDTNRIVRHRATGYAQRPGGGFQISMTTLPIVGDGAVFTTVNDLVAWDRNFYDNRLGEGGPALIDRWQEQAVLDDGELLPYAAGINVGTHRGLRLLSHGGSFVGFRAEMLRYPDQRLGIVTLCNVAGSNPSALARRVAEQFLGDAMQPVAEGGSEAGGDREAAPAEEFPLPVAELRQYAGRYVSTELGATYMLEVQDGTLHWRIPERFGAPMMPAEADRFAAPHPLLGEEAVLTFRFARASDGDVTGYMLDAGRVKNVWFAKVE